MFNISLAIFAGLSIILHFGLSIIAKLFITDNDKMLTESFSEGISNPFYIWLFIVIMYISLINFFYADIAGGYIKNLAGQVRNKRDLLFSKLIAGVIHNLVFLVVGVVSNIICIVILSTSGLIEMKDDENIFAAVITLLLVWMLSAAIAAMLLFITNAVKNKTFATVAAVFFATGALGLVYMGVNSAVSNIFKTSNFDLANYMPDTLIGSVNVAANTSVIVPVIVSIAFTVVFTALSIVVFNSRDVK